MLDIDYKIDTKGFKVQEIGYGTLVRSSVADLSLTLTNNGQFGLFNLNVRPVLESYTGQEKAQLFQWLDAKIIETIPPKGKVTLNFKIMANFPGLISVAIYVTDSANNIPLTKRTTDTDYRQAPVRWWFHVIDNISIKTLRALRAWVAEKQAGEKK